MRRSLRDGSLGVVVALLAVITGVFGPHARRLSDDLLGYEYVDHYGTQWFYWYTERQVRAGAPLGHTDLFFYPWGKDVYLHTGSNVLDALAAVPFRALLGPTLGYNVFVLAGLLATGLAMAGVVVARTRDRAAGVLAAAVVTCSPYVLVELAEGRPTQAILLLPVLFVGAMLRAGEVPGWRWPVVAGLLLAASGYQYWYYAFFGGIVALAHGLWRTARPPEGAGAGRDILLRHVVMALVAIGACLPVGLGLLALAQEGSQVPGLLDTSRWTLSESAPMTRQSVKVGLMLWQPLVETAGYFLADPGGKEGFLPRAAMLPWAVLALAALGLARARWPARRALPGGLVVTLMVATALVAMGPLVVLPGGLVLPNAPYIALAKGVGIVQRLWWPGRAAAFAVLVVAIAGAQAVAEVRVRSGRRLANVLAVGALLALLPQLQGASLAPFPAWDAGVPAAYRCLAGRLPDERAGEAGAILELPYNWNQAHLHYQPTHGRPILGGMLENNPTFTPPESETLRTTNTFVRGVIDLATFHQGDATTWGEDDRAAVRALGYRYVVLQKDALAGGEQADLRAAATRSRTRSIRTEMALGLGEPVYEDARTAIYAPWGDPSPCAANPPSPDTSPRRDGEVTAGELLPDDPTSFTLTRVF